jgi:hypothetical protein
VAHGSRYANSKSWNELPVDSGGLSAVELRLGEERACQLQDLVGPAQLLDLAFQILHALRLGRRDAFANTRFDLHPLDPFEQRLRHATDLRRN